MSVLKKETELKFLLSRGQSLLSLGAQMESWSLYNQLYHYLELQGSNRLSSALPENLAVFSPTSLGVCHPSSQHKNHSSLSQNWFLFMEQLAGAFQGQALPEKQACFFQLSGAFRNNTLLWGSQNSNRKISKTYYKTVVQELGHGAGERSIRCEG